PIIVGDRVFVASCLVDQKTPEKPRVLICLDRRSGKILWEREVLASLLEPKHGLNSYASSTPASDGARVYISFLRSRPLTPEDSKVAANIRDAHVQWKTAVPEMVVACYSVEGNKLWEKVPGR